MSKVTNLTAMQQLWDGGLGSQGLRGGVLKCHCLPSLYARCSSNDPLLVHGYRRMHAPNLSACASHPPLPPSWCCTLRRQVFVKGEFVGGADILLSMHESGELEKMLAPIRKEQKAQ